MKKKATIIILTAILIGSFYNEIYSQDLYHFNAYRNMVIAANGLNMRSLPKTTSKKLVNIPYGERVTIVHKDHYGLDTVYTIKTELGDHPVYGHWQKVQYKEYIGYVHNAFLTYTWSDKMTLVPGTNEDYILLKPGYDCSSNFHNTNEYFWYGYYQEMVEFGQPLKKPYRKLIDVEFINIANDMSGSGTIVKENRHLQFIIGTKKKFEETDLENIQERQLYHHVDMEIIELDSNVVKQGDISLVINEEPVHGYFDTEFFYLTRGENTQLINTVTEKYRIKMGYTFRQGDFDGDGHLDYIFGHGEDDYHIGLYLSSEVGEEEVVKLVAMLHRGPCC